MKDKITIEYEEEILWDKLTEREQLIFNAGVAEGRDWGKSETWEKVAIGSLLVFIGVVILYAIIN